MIRFSHTLFALPFALLAAAMAWTAPAADGRIPVFRWRDLVGILLCMVFARSAAMAFNRLADRRWDAANPRTRARHLPAGTLSAASVTVFTLTTSLGFVASTLLFYPNILPLVLSLPVLSFLFAYSYTKRFTAFAHFWLGLSLMLAPVSAWIAIRGEIVISTPADLMPAALLGLAVMLWVAGFDVIYACQDADYDVRARLHSIPANLGVGRALRVAAWCHAGMVVVLASLPWLAPHLPFGWIYGSGVAVVALLLAYEHWLVRPDNLARVNVAFFQVNSIVSIGLFVVGTIDLFV